MARTFWFALGATGGVLAYRKGQQLIEQARQRGVVGSVYAATESASAVATGAKDLVQRGLSGLGTPEDDGPEVAGSSGTAAARALAAAKHTQRMSPPRDTASHQTATEGHT
ncbi:MAG: hypothetical protein WAO41_01140 [Candidatus Nanopelagicales bacterium]